MIKYYRNIKNLKSGKNGDYLTCFCDILNRQYHYLKSEINLEDQIILNDKRGIQLTIKLRIHCFIVLAILEDNLEISTKKIA